MDLYRELTQAEALSAFATRPDHPRFFGDICVVTDDAVLWFLVVREGGAVLASSRDVRWTHPNAGATRPPKGVEAIRAWMAELWPKPVVDVYERTETSMKRIRTHQLFLSEAGSERFVYVGDAHLGSYGGDGEACLTLGAQLPREIWLRFGGYSGWQVELAHDLSIVASDDRSKFDAILGEFVIRPFAHLVLTRYEQDALHVFKNERCAFVMYLRRPDDGGLYLDRGPLPGASEDDVFECDCGISLTYSSRMTSSLEEGLEVARRFFLTGVLPDDRPWTEEVVG